MDLRICSGCSEEGDALFKGQSCSFGGSLGFVFALVCPAANNSDLDFLYDLNVVLQQTAA